MWPEGHIGFGEIGKNSGWRISREQMTLLIIVASLSAAYGGVHAAAWNFLFPSSVEHLLWKISCIVCIAGSMPASITAMAIADALSFARGSFGAISRLERLRMDWGSGLIFCSITLPIFIAARIYMVVESFLSLRFSAIGTYAIVEWAQYIPHF